MIRKVLKILVLVLVLVGLFFAVRWLISYGKAPYDAAVAQVPPTATPTPADPAVKAEVETEAEAEVLETTEPPMVDLSDLDLAEILAYLRDENFLFYNQHLFGETWTQVNGDVVASLPEDYNVTVLSSDPARLMVEGSVLYQDMEQGFLAVIVGSEDIRIKDVGFSDVNDHRNVSGYALAVKLSGAELQEFAIELAAFEWSREFKPALIVYFVDTAELHVLQSAEAESLSEASLASMIGSLFALPAGD